MKPLLLPALLLVGLQACATDETTPFLVTPSSIEPAMPEAGLVTKLAMIHGGTHRVGRDTGLVDADRIVLSDGIVDLRVSSLVGDLDLAHVTHLDLTTQLGDDGNWHVELSPGLILTRQARSFCTEWVTVVTYKADGTMKVDIVCLQEVHL